MIACPIAFGYPSCVDGLTIVFALIGATLLFWRRADA